MFLQYCRNWGTVLTRQVLGDNWQILAIISIDLAGELLLWVQEGWEFLFGEEPRTNKFGNVKVGRYGFTVFFYLCRPVETSPRLLPPKSTQGLWGQDTPPLPKPTGPSAAWTGISLPYGSNPTDIPGSLIDTSALLRAVNSARPRRRRYPLFGECGGTLPQHPLREGPPSRHSALRLTP